MTNKNKITIYDVAKKAGVSRQTVSRVLNNRQDVSVETRRRVQEIIDDFNYHPSAIARSLSQRRTHTLGVAASGIEYYGPSRQLLGIEQAANKLGYSIILNLIHRPEDGNVEKVFRNLISRQVEGIIWLVPQIGDNHSWLRKEAQQLATPVIFIDMQPYPQFNTITMDNYNGGRLATEHLLSQGNQQIGLITGPQNWWSAQERIRGWREALVTAGCSYEERQMVEGDWTAGSGERGLKKLLDNFPEMEAVFVSNDQMAFGVYQAANQIGKCIPDDLAVVGFDDIPESGYFCPRLTTVRQDLYELGNVAVETFIAVHENEQSGEPARSSKNLVLQPQLIVRQSSTVDNQERSRSTSDKSR